MAHGEATHVGRVRAHNEDAYLADPELGLWIVADGMGGHQCGEVASRIAVDFIREEVARGGTLFESVERAHEVVLLAAGQGLGHPGMGSTVVGLKFDDRDFDLVWVGDSRAYLWDGHQLVRLTRDHSLVQQLVEIGELSEEQATLHPSRNIITQALGASDLERVEPERVQGTLCPGQQLLLCSDGLTSEVSDAVIEKVLSESADEQTKVTELIQRALEAGGADNITAILVTGPDAGSEKQPSDTIPIDLDALATEHTEVPGSD